MPVHIGDAGDASFSKAAAAHLRDTAAVYASGLAALLPAADAERIKALRSETEGATSCWASNANALLAGITAKAAATALPVTHVLVSSGARILRVVWAGFGMLRAAGCCALPM
jgi:hypothetical protein